MSIYDLSNRHPDDLMRRLRATTAEIGGDDAVAEIDALEKRLQRYSHLPGVLKGLAKLDFSAALCDAAAYVVRGSTMQKLVDDTLFGAWAVFVLAARSDASVIDEIEAGVSGDYVAARVRELRNGTKKAVDRRAAEPQVTAEAAPAASGNELAGPASVGKVKAWLRDHPDADPRILAPKPKQKAAMVAAAIRALAQLGTPAAFEVIKQYATDKPTDPMLEELKRAWHGFDEREFAAAMFRPSEALGHLDLGIVTKLDGIDAVDGLRSLRVVIDDNKSGQTDLTPLRDCSTLTSLDVQFNEPVGPANVDWLRPLSGLRSLRLAGPMDGVDLTVLREINVQSLSISLVGCDGSILLEVPQLKELTLVGASARHDPGPAVAAHPGLTQVVLDLVERGVAVSVYSFDSWSSEVLAEAETAGMHLTGRSGLTTIDAARQSRRSERAGPVG
ncbi:hypothetical protein [Cumulibacter soli]|uniref:hypothetical protein n=1 Tax=Cumulibacter soli TaxID=2546344 RepID=UPI0010684641|nr:hypothetical protein [Cumulibacter soli]